MATTPMQRWSMATASRFSRRSFLWARRGCTDRDCRGDRDAGRPAGRARICQHAELPPVDL
jgi:hypothetical protein